MPVIDRVFHWGRCLHAVLPHAFEEKRRPAKYGTDLLQYPFFPEAAFEHAAEMPELCGI